MQSPSGLRWVSDDAPGLSRRPAPGADPPWRLFDARGRRVEDAATLQRVRKLAIPPAWTDVWICASPDGHLQATGRDARGRKQYRYHADWSAHRGERKFEHLAAFASVLPRVRRRVQRVLDAATRTDRVAGPCRDEVLATLVHLLDATHMRIGNEAYARQNGSFGLSTLRNRHAGIRGATLRLSFAGKSGVRHEVAVTDRRIARLVRRCRELPGQELFQYVDEQGQTHRVDSSDVNGWLAETAGIDVTAKDFRTWHGSVRALEHAVQACRDDDAACSAPQVIHAVARVLGNTPAVCRKAYVHPCVLAVLDRIGSAAGRSELLGQPWLQPPATRGLSAAERQLAALLNYTQRRTRQARRARQRRPALSA